MPERPNRASEDSIPMPRKTSENAIVDFRNGVHRKPGESVIEASHRAKKLALERRAEERLAKVVAEFLAVFAKYEGEMPKGEAARVLENFVANKLSESRLVLLLLDAETAKRSKSDADLLPRLHKIAAG